MSKEKTSKVEGTIIGHNDGYGFLRPEDGKDDVYLPPTEMLKVMHGDRVVVKVFTPKNKNKAEGSITEILDRANTELVGRLVIEQGIYLVVPEEKRIKHDIVIPKDDLNKAEVGQVVLIHLVDPPTKVTPPIGKVIEIIGSIDDPGIETSIAIRKFKIPYKFSKDVYDQQSLIDGKCLANQDPLRTDLTDISFFTVDGADAKDFDDAIYAESYGRDSWRVLVAIADVSHFVKPDDAVDKEAFLRGTSVYFPRTVIPMIPEFLSNKLCSILPGEKRKVLVCDMVIDADGEIKGYQFYEANIRSRARFTYEQLWEIIRTRDIEAFKGVGDKLLIDSIFSAYSAYHSFLRNRKQRGALEFETVEASIKLDNNGQIEDISATRRTDAHKIIEECMIAANKCAAHFISVNKRDSLYRIHEEPEEDKLNNLQVYLKTQGVNWDFESPVKSCDVSKLLESVKKRLDSQILQSLTLRTMRQACYSPENIGHFALALENYTHFTSPIRRYPDLIVHRVIKSILYGEDFKPSSDFKYTRREDSSWVVLGERTSFTERRAEEASRDVISFLKCQFMQQRVGEQMRGVVTSVVPFGLFITLDDLFVEGLIHVSELGQEFFQFISTSHELRGERTGKRFKLYDRVLVQLMRVDIDNRRIQFALLGRQEQISGKTNSFLKGKKRKQKSVKNLKPGISS